MEIGFQSVVFSLLFDLLFKIGVERASPEFIAGSFVLMCIRTQTVVFNKDDFASFKNFCRFDSQFK